MIVNAHSVVDQGDRRVVVITLQSKVMAPTTVTTPTSVRLVNEIIYIINLFKAWHYVLLPAIIAEHLSARLRLGSRDGYIYNCRMAQTTRWLQAMYEEGEVEHINGVWPVSLLKTAKISMVHIRGVALSTYK